MTCKTGAGSLSVAMRCAFGLAGVWAGRLPVCVDASVGEGKAAKLLRLIATSAELQP